MKRTLVYITLQFILGIIIGKFLRVPIISGLFIFFGILFIYVLALLFLNNAKISKFLFPIVVIICGIFAINISIYSTEGNIIDFAGREVTVEGTVIEEPLIKASEVVYTLKTSKAIENNRVYPIDGSILVRVKNGDNIYIYKYSDKLRIKGTIFLPFGLRNPGGFNYKEHLLAEGICANLYTVDSNIKSLGKDKTNPLKNLAYTIKEKAYNKIDILYPNEEKAVLSGIMLGIKGEIPDYIIESFIKSGIYHILAVSGLHVGYIVAILYFIFNRSQYRLLGLIITIIGIIIYIVIVGARSSVIRAGIMSIIALIALQFGKEKDSITSLAAAALVILIINPLSLFMPGFQLSFGATLGIIVLFPRIRKTFYFLPKGIADLVCVTISAQLGILPLLIYYFGEISIICILTNVLILPLIGVIIILGFVSIITAFILPQIGSIIGAVNSLLIKLIINSSLFFSRLPYSTISIKTPSILLIITYYLFLYSLIKRNKKAFTLLTLLIVIIIWHPIVIGGVSGLEVTFIDVGQGDAIFIKTPKGKNIMIDSGGLPDYYLGDFDIGTDVILPFLRYKGVRKLDMIFISHIHDDHIKGFIPVLDEISVDYFVQAPQKVLTPNYKLLIDKLKKYNIPVISVSKGDYITLEKDLELYVLHPDLEWISRDPFDFNNNSLVIMMKYKNTTFLFTGDIESAAESKIADDFRLQLKSDVLKVAHHGSNTSSIDSLIENIQPSIAIISVGRNTFGHPHNDVINRIKALGVDIFRTDVDGAVTIKTNGYKIKCNTTIKN